MTNEDLKLLEEYQSHPWVEQFKCERNASHNTPVPQLYGLVLIVFCSDCGSIKNIDKTLITLVRQRLARIYRDIF